MGKKKAPSEKKPGKPESKPDKMAALNEKNSAKKQKQTSTAAKSGFLTGTTVFLIVLSGMVVLGAVIVINKDAQNFLVSLTPIGSNPLEYIIGREEQGGPSAKNSASNTGKDVLKQGKDTQTSEREKRTSEKSETNLPKSNVDEDSGKISDHDKGENKANKGDSSKTETEKTKDNQNDPNAKNKEKMNIGKSSDVKIEPGNNDREDSLVETEADLLDNTTEKPKKKANRKDYAKNVITSKADFKIRKKLDAADTLREEGKLNEALSKYTTLLSSYPDSPRSLFGKALVTDSLAERQQSNKLLEEAIELMNHALRLDDTPKQLRIQIGNKLAERQSFRGWEGKAAVTWRYLMEKYPDDITFQQKYGTSNLLMGKNDRAREVYRKILTKHPDDIYSLVHLGFIVKVVDTNYQEAIPLLQRGIDLDTEGTIEGKFFYHLGDAYVRTNQSEKAAAVYRQGAERGLFLSQYQRSLYNADTPLTGRPWWTPEQTTYQSHLKVLEKNWKTIREEGLNQLNPKSGSFLPEEENLRETGDWKQFTLYQRGRKNEENCKKVPKTCALLERIPDAVGCKRGQVKYSVMHPGVHVWPHTGPTNCRIRAHLGLKVPPGPRIRVGNDTRTWMEGKFIIFDDSFEHEVWHDGDDLRLVLIVDFWHPELTDHQKRILTPI